MTMQSSPKTSRVDFNTPAMQRHRAVRHFKDHLTRWYVAVGGLGVIVAVLLIFLYLLSEVVPLFGGADIEQQERYSTPWLDAADPPLMLAMEEQGEVAIRVSEAGQVTFFKTSDGKLISEQRLPIPEGVTVSSFSVESPNTRRFAVGLSNGQVIIGKHNYKVTYPNDVRLITPELNFPYGEEPLVLDEQGRALEHVSMSGNDSGLTLAANVGRELLVTSISRQENMMTGEVTTSQTELDLTPAQRDVDNILIDPLRQWMYVVNGVTDGPVGMMEGKRATVLVASGGTRVRWEIDCATPWLRHVLGFVVIADLEIIAADASGAGPQRLAEAKERIKLLAAA